MTYEEIYTPIFASIPFGYLSDDDLACCGIYHFEDESEVLSDEYYLSNY